MYSALLLISIWLFLLGLSSMQQDKRQDKDYLLPVMFVVACIVMTNASYLLINSHSAPRLINHLLVGTSLSLLATCLLLPSWRRSIPTALGCFFLPCTNIEPTNNRFASVMRTTRIAMVTFTALLMLTLQFVTPTLMNWDSNWYNVSRVPAMVLTRTTFPENAPVPFQALYPLAHDLLYLYDISMLNLRGMGLITVLEFFVILGCLYKISQLLLTGKGIDNASSRHQFALLLITALFLGSDLQVFQSVETKNDLVITMCFTINTMLSIDFRQRQENPLRNTLSWLIVGSYALASNPME